MFNISSVSKRVIFSLYMISIFLVIGGFFIYEGLNSPWPWMLLPLFIFAPVLHMALVPLPYLAWEDSYNVGVEEIDYDHKKLLELLNRVALLSNYTMGDAYFMEILNKLIDYTKYHLGREENLMMVYEYPDRESHILQHEKFIGSIDALYNKISKEDIIEYHKVFDFLKNWLLKHIAHTDKDLGAFIQNARLTAK